MKGLVLNHVSDASLFLLRQMGVDIVFNTGYKTHREILE